MSLRPYESTLSESLSLYIYLRGKAAEGPNGSACSTDGEVDWGYDILEDALERPRGRAVGVAAAGSEDEEGVVRSEWWCVVRT